MKITRVTLFLLLAFSNLYAQTYKLSIKPKNATTNEDVTLFSYREVNQSTETKVLNNEITEKRGNHIYIITADNYLPYLLKINLISDTLVVFKITPEVNLLKEVSITSSNRNKESRFQTGHQRISQSEIFKIPAIFGDKDIVRAMQLLPGITSSSEGAADLNIRGGSADQNLLLLDGIPLYSNSHLLGLVSVFNPSLIAFTDVYKSGFPSQYGGRTAGIVDVTTLSGNSNTFYGNGSFGIISTSGFLNFPIVNNKSSLIVAGRRSFFDLLKRLTDNTGENYSYYDLYSKYNHQISERWKFQLSGFTDFDKNSFVRKSDISKDLYNKSSLKKTQLHFLAQVDYSGSGFENKIQLYYNKYKLSINEDDHLRAPDYLISVANSSITDIGTNWIGSIILNKKQKLELGAQAILHQFSPSKVTLETPIENTERQILPQKQAFETAFFAEHKFDIQDNIHLRLGGRLSAYNSTKKTFYYAEPRVAFSYEIAGLNFKSSFTRAHQPIQTLINNGLGLPIDIIVTSDNFIKPQYSTQYALGVEKPIVISNAKFLFSLEGYYKLHNNIITYKDGFDSRSFTIGSILSVNNWQEGIAVGKGKSRGVEVQLENKEGKLQGWINYTWAKTQHSFNDLDNGEHFFPKQDRRHVFNLFQHGRISKKWSASVVFNYASGQAITTPIFTTTSQLVGLPGQSGSYIPGNFLIYEQGKRGGSRMKDFHKLDISFTRELNFFNTKGQLELGLYNVYNRRNSYFYTLGYKKVQNIKVPIIQSVSLLPIIPFATVRTNF